MLALAFFYSKTTLQIYQPFRLANKNAVRQKVDN